MCQPRSLKAGLAANGRAFHQQPRHRPKRIVIPRCQGAGPSSVVSTSTSSTDTPLLELGWRTDLREAYVFGKVLGTGSFGTVHLGVESTSGREVAIKTLPKQRPKLTRARVLEKLQRELTLLDRLSGCPRVVQLLECFEDEDNVYIVTEACQGGDLQKFSDTYGPLTERCLALVALEVLLIVRNCHRLGILHGDVKPANFCLKDEHRHPYAASPAALQRTPWLKAIDFGCSQLHFRPNRLSKRSGTPVYMAPEIFKRDYSFEVDVWSTGVLLYQLFCRQFPFWHGDSYNKALSLDDVARAITEADIRMDFGPWLTMSHEGLDFIRGCLTRDPATRLTLDEALEHPWLQKFANSSDAAPGPLVEAEVSGSSVTNNIVRRAAGQQAAKQRRDAAVAA